MVPTEPCPAHCGHQATQEVDLTDHVVALVSDVDVVAVGICGWLVPAIVVATASVMAVAMAMIRNS